MLSIFCWAWLNRTMTASSRMLQMSRDTSVSRFWDFTRHFEVGNVRGRPDHGLCFSSWKEDRETRPSSASSLAYVGFVATPLRRSALGVNRPQPPDNSRYGEFCRQFGGRKGLSVVGAGGVPQLPIAQRQIVSQRRQAYVGKFRGTYQRDDKRWMVCFRQT
jgi:hypothetical protein